LAGAATSGFAFPLREVSKTRFDVPRQSLILALALAGSIVPAAAQNSSYELRPEVGIYLQEWQFIRMEFIKAT
jgi:hypothetical protein